MNVYRKTPLDYAFHGCRWSRHRSQLVPQQFLYDLFWALLETYHIKQADTVAFVLAHITPFIVSIAVALLFYFVLRYEFTRKPSDARAITIIRPDGTSSEASLPGPKIGIQIDEANRGIATVRNLEGSPTRVVQFIVSPATEAPLIRCEAWVTQIERTTEPSGAFVEDPLRCPWNQRVGEERFRVTIAAGLTQRANLFSVTAEEGLIPLLEPTQTKLASEITTSGQYRISVLVTADDAPSESASFIFECQHFRNVWLARSPGNLTETIASPDD